MSAKEIAKKVEEKYNAIKDINNGKRISIRKK